VQIHTVKESDKRVEQELVVMVIVNNPLTALVNSS
jgi:hypothetical protein